MKKTTKLFITGILCIIGSYICAVSFDNASEALKTWYFMFGIFSGLVGLLMTVFSFIFEE